MENVKRKPDERRSRGNVLVIILMFFAIEVFSLGDLIEIIPFFSPLMDFALFGFFHEIHNLLATCLVLFTTYKYGSRLGVTAIGAYFAIHVVYFTIQRDEWPENMMEITHVVLASLVGLLGVWLINQLHNAEKLLKYSNEDLEVAQRLSKIGNWKWTIATGEVIWSQELSLINGWDPAKTPPPFAEMSSFYTPESRKRLNEAVTKTFNSREPFDLDLDIIRTDGTVIKTKTRGEADFDINGKLSNLHGTVQDITEQKRAEEQIRHLANMLRTIRNINQLITREKDRGQLVQKSCDLLLQGQNLEEVWILLFDTTGNIIAGGNKTISRESSAFLEELKTGRYPDCLMQVLAPGKKFMAFQQPGKLHHGCMMSAAHTDKDTFRCKLEHDTRTYGVMGISGPAGTAFDIDERDLFIELCSDISFALDSLRRETERKAAEEAHRLSEENFRHSVDASPLGIRILDTQGKTVYANRAVLEMYGFKNFEELNSPPNSNIYTPEAYLKHRKRVDKRSKGEYVPLHYEVNIVRPDGDIRHLDVLRSDVVWNGTPQFQQLYQDITEVKNLQQQLIMQDRLVSIGQLVSGVAHELNNPLTSVIGFSELLLQRQLPDDIRADLKIVNEEAKRTSTIVKNLLMFARQQPQDKYPIQINEPIQSVLLLRNHEQSVNSIGVNTSFTPDLPLVMANGSQLQQVFFNLVTNAEFAMTEAHNRGTITITTERAGDFVRVSIADDGPGIAPENMKRLFSPFFTTKDLGKGTGLGLSICQGIIAEHGGKIWAESEPGRGATFKVELPACVPSQLENDNK
ncbi:MAG: ATP-binding protein [Dehalococcoidales bacterium]|nr:ATP-binding protein [Dehalococcoidales bacterium]